VRTHHGSPAKQEHQSAAQTVPQGQVQQQQQEQKSNVDKPLTAVLQNFYIWQKASSQWQPHHASPNIDGQRLRSSAMFITWNLNHAAPNPRERVETSFSYIRSLLVTSSDSIAPAVITLQEVHADALDHLASLPFVRNNFHMTDCTTANVLWSNPSYGTITLIDKRLRVNAVFRVNYTDTSVLGRDVLFVDLEMKSFSATDGKKIRVGNTHLESPIVRSALDWQVRSKQMRLATMYMRDGNMAGALLAGDMHSITPEDALLPQQNGLRDGHLENGLRNTDQESHTFGYQSKSSEQSEKGQRDKVLMIGKVKIEEMRRIGEGIKVKGEEGAWVSDHFGVMGTLRVL